MSMSLRNGSECVCVGGLGIREGREDIPDVLMERERVSIYPGLMYALVLLSLCFLLYYSLFNFQDG